jgi:membrane associated rhomboid family serine protease
MFFFFLPVGMNYRTERFPIVTLSLIGLNTLAYLISLVFFFRTDGESNAWIYAHLWLIPAQSFPWTWLTSMFVHAGIFHLAGNMIYLFLFGSCVEDMIGRLRFTLFYLVSGFIAELTFIATSPEHFLSMTPMGGASGAITGCLAMCLLLHAEVEIEFKYVFLFFVLTIFFRAGEFEIPAWIAIVFWFLKDVFSLAMSYNPHSHAHGGGGVAFGAHVGGFLGGLALVALYKWQLKSRAEESVEPRLILDPATVLAAAPVRPSPGAAASETPAIFLHDGTEQTGPFTLSQVQAKLQNGEISREAQYWSEGMAEWQSVVDLSGQPLA